MNIGDHVIYVDEHGKAHQALLTSVFDNGDKETYPRPTVNLVYVSDDPQATDQYGRQLATRACSRVHESNTTARGSFWRLP